MKKVDSSKIREAEMTDNNQLLKDLLVLLA
jgi:hypothetical protein